MKAFHAVSLRSVLGLTLFSSVNSLAAGAKTPEYSGERVPANMGMIGDSISAGMLAGYERQSLLLPWNIIDLAIRGGFALGSGNTKVLERRDYTWGTGQSTFYSVPSHALRLEAISGQKLDVVNAAVSGAKVNDVLNFQLGSLRDESQRKFKTEYPEYVVLLIGANDTCAENVNSMTSVADYEHRMSRIADDILENSPNTKFLISSLPNIAILQDVARNERTAHTTCGGLWKTQTFCNTLMNLSDHKERALVAKRVEDFNASIKSIVEERREIHGDRIRFAEETYNTKFNANDLSPDCFHPNASGQAKIADSSFKGSWWQGAWETGGAHRFSNLRKKARKKNMGHPGGKR